MNSLVGKLGNVPAGGSYNGGPGVGVAVGRGVAVGVAVGRGLAVGVAVGREVARGVGVGVGSDVARAVGAAVLPSVAAAVGFAVGAMVGAPVVMMDGGEVGGPVGAPVGALDVRGVAVAAALAPGEGAAVACEPTSPLEGETNELPLPPLHPTRAAISRVVASVRSAGAWVKVISYSLTVYIEDATRFNSTDAQNNHVP